MRRKVCFITGTRADYGIMSRLMGMLRDRNEIELQIIVTNMHLSPEYGLTYREIESDGFKISRKVEMLLSSDTAAGTVKSMGLGAIGMADALDELRPDLVVILGDRYEMLAAASAALIFRIPIVHLYGGEVTEGAYDDAIRNAITQMATLHFTSTEEYRQRIIAMGKPAENVWHAGSLGVENIESEQMMSLGELNRSLGSDLKEGFLLVTFHPATAEPGLAALQTEALLKALETAAEDRDVLFTMPNSDTEGRVVASLVEDWVRKHHDRAFAAASLGRKRYYSALSHCSAVVGNSSSGLIEAPSFGVPTLNIGDRQKGRARGNTIVDCAATTEAVTNGLLTVLSTETRQACSLRPVNPYARPGSAAIITGKIMEFLAAMPNGSNTSNEAPIHMP